MIRHLCIHGHFYQPPREDPWLGRIFIEPSAAPMRHWNERIVHESYGPLGWARRLGRDGRITDIVNCYEWINFNVGPTLLSWMARHTPREYSRILEADAGSLARWGHGNAIAQVYHHVIMPLASERDKRLEVEWALQDFQERFGRDSEGMWLAECAVDTPTLEVLAEAGITYVILAPRQAEAVAEEGGDFHPVVEETVSCDPYRVELPSGREMAVFFYHGGISQAIAFEGLLADGERFWSRINGAAGPGLLSLSTDGETYGHHFPFGEMALAYVLGQAMTERDGIRLTNYGAYLAANPPTRRVRIKEPSSWSCVHGVERWKSDCGCKDGGHPSWNQKWRAPLRAALEQVRQELDKHFFTAAKACLDNPEDALRAYGRVLVNPLLAEEFSRRHMKRTDPACVDRAWKLLAMQEQALAAFASCAWFFDDLARIEPVNAMTYMWRAMELARQTGGPDLRDTLAGQLAEARSNNPEEGNGGEILARRVVPREQNAASLTLMALLELQRKHRIPEGGQEEVVAWPNAAVHIIPDTDFDPMGNDLTGSAIIRTALEVNGRTLRFRWHAPSFRPHGCEANGLDRFISTRESHVTVTLEDGSTQSRSVESLPAHIRDYMALSIMTEFARQEEPHLEAVARHAASLLREWEEAQHTLAYPEYWVQLAPQLILACVTEEKLEFAVRERLAQFLMGLNLSATTRARAHHILEIKLDRAMQAPDPNWDMLELWVNRGRRLLPDMNWWVNQNTLWQLGPVTGPHKRLAAALNYRV